MKISYFESTWAASCVASTGGALYSAVVLALVSGGEISMAIAWVVLVSIGLSLPVLIAGSAIIGWWVTKMLAHRIRTGRILVFTMAGMLMGMIVDLILFLLALVFSSGLLEMPRGMGGWMNAVLAASIPWFYLTLAGLVAGMHVTRSEKTISENPELLDKIKNPPCLS